MFIHIPGISLFNVVSTLKLMKSNIKFRNEVEISFIDFFSIGNLPGSSKNSCLGCATYNFVAAFTERLMVRNLA